MVTFGLFSLSPCRSSVWPRYARPCAGQSTRSDWSLLIRDQIFRVRQRAYRTGPKIPLQVHRFARRGVFEQITRPSKGRFCPAMLLAVVLPERL
jgi:hypothetical protein